MTKDELSEKRNRAIKSLNDVEAILGLDEMYIDELEAKNKELKADNDARKFAMAMSEKVEKQLREENAELKKMYHESDEDNNKLRENIPLLAEAKELLAKWVELFKPKLEGYPITPIQEQTEQFLKESE